MNLLSDIAPEVISPPALVQAAFDEVKAVAECRVLIERRDDARGDYSEAIIALGQKLIDARKAMPGPVLKNGTESYSPRFLVFIEKLGLSRSTAVSYMCFARNPQRLANAHNRYKRYTVGGYRKKTLTEVQELLIQASTLEEARRVIEEELNEIK